MLQPWKTIGTRDIIRDKWIHLRADKCQLAGGEVVEPYYVIEGNDWVHVVGFTADFHLLLVRQYRHAAGVVCWELPGGAAGDKEDVLAAAQREMLEETGAVSEAWMPIGGYWSNPARNNNQIHGFIAKNIRVVRGQDLDRTEEIRCGFFPISEVVGLINRGEFPNVSHIALLYRALELVGALHHTGGLVSTR